MLESFTFLSPWLYAKVYIVVIAILTIICMYRYARLDPAQQLSSDFQLRNNFPAIILIIAVLFNITIKLINKSSLKTEILESAQYMLDK